MIQDLDYQFMFIVNCRSKAALKCQVLRSLLRYFALNTLKLMHTGKATQNIISPQYIDIVRKLQYLQ